MIFGDKPDKLIDSINRFMLHAESIRIVLSENNVPLLVLNMLYLPMYGLVMVLNCLKEALIWWIIAFVIYCAVMGITGALLTLLYTGYKAYNAYSDKFDENGMPKEKTEDKGDETHVPKP